MEYELERLDRLLTSEVAKRQALELLVKEIQISVEKLLRFDGGGSPGFPDSSGSSGSEYGLLLSMSVEEVALLKKVMRQSGFLLNKNVKKMMEDVAKVIHTKQRYSVSATSLYNSFYSVELRTVDSLKDKLMTMVNVLRKMESELKS